MIIRFFKWLLNLGKDERVEPNVDTVEGQVLAVLRAFPDSGRTDNELGFILNIWPDATHVAAARERLVGRGFVANSGRTRVNPNTGRDNTVWVAI